MEYIHRIPNLLSKEVCEKLIDKFEKSELKAPGLSYIANDSGEVKRLSFGEEFKSESNVVPQSIKKSTDISFSEIHFETNKLYDTEDWFDLIDLVYKKLTIGVRSYVGIHPNLDTLHPFGLDVFNMQRYLPGEGFYNWHCEDAGNPIARHRILAWMIYLNDVDDGGTEFMTQNHTEKAEMGKFLIWPAGWTHFHRGQVSNTKTKYILTGWYIHID